MPAEVTTTTTTDSVDIGRQKREATAAGTTMDPDLLEIFGQQHEEMMSKGKLEEHNIITGTIRKVVPMLSSAATFVRDNQGVNSIESRQTFQQTFQQSFSTTGCPTLI